MKPPTKTQIKAENDRWFNAVCDEDIPTLDQMISNGFDINTLHRRQHSTGLQFCGKWGMTKSTNWLISKGADVDASSHVDLRPLWAAIHGHNYHIARALVLAGADVNACNEDGTNMGGLLLKTGLRPDRLDLLRPMIDAGLDVEIQDIRGESVRSLIELGIKRGEADDAEAWRDLLGADQARKMADTLDEATPLTVKSQSRRTL